MPYCFHTVSLFSLGQLVVHRPPFSVWPDWGLRNETVQAAMLGMHGSPYDDVTSSAVNTAIVQISGLQHVQAILNQWALWRNKKKGVFPLYNRMLSNTRPVTYDNMTV